MRASAVLKVTVKKVLFLAVMVAMFSIACGTTAGSTDEDRDDLEVVGFEWSTGEFDSRFIEGTARNNTDRTLTFVSLNFTLYDADGQPIGGSSDIFENLGPNDIWNFKAVVYAEDAVTAKVTKVEAY